MFLAFFLFPFIFMLFSYDLFYCQDNFFYFFSLDITFSPSHSFYRFNWFAYYYMAFTSVFSYDYFFINFIFLQALVDDLLDHRLNRVTVDLPGKDGEMRTPHIPFFYHLCSSSNLSYYSPLLFLLLLLIDISTFTPNRYFFFHS